jgi:tRNA A22 N-methylase
MVESRFIKSSIYKSIGFKTKKEALKFINLTILISNTKENEENFIKRLLEKLKNNQKILEKIREENKNNQELLKKIKEKEECDCGSHNCSRFPNCLDSQFF